MPEPEAEKRIPDNVNRWMKEEFSGNLGYPPISASRNPTTSIE